MSLNSTAAPLWKHVEGTDFNADTLTDFLMENDEVGSETAKRDAEQFPVFNSRSFPSNPCQLSSLSTRWNRCQSQ
ncbi:MULTISPECIES: PqqD family protein [Bacteroides]|uniref:PqqD family protein n=1 Tax=Bacteroides TaxID=816 RepID=UPI002102EA54|nr:MULTISPECIES: PqqD family protein [Bacteroides]